MRIVHFFSCLFWWKLYPSSGPMTWKGAVQNSVGFHRSPLKPGSPESTNSFMHTGDMSQLSLYAPPHHTPTRARSCERTDAKKVPPTDFFGVLHPFGESEWRKTAHLWLGSDSGVSLPRLAAEGPLGRCLRATEQRFPTLSKLFLINPPLCLLLSTAV